MRRSNFHRLVGWISWHCAPLIKSDELLVKMRFWSQLGYKLNLDTPRTFNEKLQWLKLYNHRPEYTMMVDKLSVKEYIAQKIGNQYIIPTLGVWDNADDIDFDKLPQQFVLKCTHDSGGLTICKDKALLDLKAVRKKMNKALKRDYYIYSREWPYKNVTKRIIAEKYLVDTSGVGLRDYKIYCFDGSPKIVSVASERSSGCVKFDYFDDKFQHLPYRQGGDNLGRPIEEPKNFEIMLQLARKISQGIPHVRTDFYNINGKIYFGELTFFDGGGTSAFEPIEWDYKLGEMLKLPTKYVQA